MSIFFSPATISSISSSSLTANKVISVATPIVATLMVAKNFLPWEVLDILHGKMRKVFLKFSSQMTMVINSLDSLASNPLYTAVHLYLGKKFSGSFGRIILSKNFEHSLEPNTDEEIVDMYRGIKFKWIFKSHKNSTTNQCAMQAYEVSFHKKYRTIVVTSYLPFIVEQAKLIKAELHQPNIFMEDVGLIFAGDGNLWRGMKFDHPATFDTLALESHVRSFIVNDLDTFLRRRDYYKKIGKSWKRGYLLYGPPGTGKSSLIAAMANYLQYDIYDIELTQVETKFDLQQLMMSTGNRSILVMEDIDCASAVVSRSGHAHSKSENLTLSGLLNSLDGLCSGWANERIIIITTNHKEKLDPALLRPGRMDVHIHLSYCTFEVFKQLALNYLELEDHPLFERIEEAISATQVTPAEIAEELLKVDSSDDHPSLQNVLHFLEKKKMEVEDPATM